MAAGCWMASCSAAWFPRLRLRHLTGHPEHWPRPASPERVKVGQTRKADALDDNNTGLTRFYSFTCSRRRGPITCRNAFGDAMRYRA